MQNCYIFTCNFVIALTSLGVEGFDSAPPGADVNKITLETFTKEA